MRAIDGDALRNKLQNLADDDWNKGTTTSCAEAFVECVDMIDDMPTIEPHCETCEAFNKTRLLIPQPERKKGKWGIAYMCSECGFIHTVIEDFGQYVYCPNCGAKMEEGEEN